MSHRRLNDSNEVGSVSIAPYEYAAVYEYLGENRYLQAAFCKSVQQLYSDKFGMYTTKSLSNIAAEGGAVGVLEWSEEIGCRWDDSLYVSGAKGGHVDILRWLVNSGCPMPDWNGYEAWIAAAERGNLEVLKFAYNSNYLKTQKFLCQVATKNGHLNILKWVHEVEGNRTFNAYTCELAAMGGSIEIIKWLRSVGCAWDMLTCWRAMTNGHVGVLKWALDNGCPWDVGVMDNDGRTALHLAGNLEVIEFLISRGADIMLKTEGGGRQRIARQHMAK